MCVKQLVLLFCVYLLTMSVSGQSMRKYQASNAGDDGFSQSGIPFTLSVSGPLEACVGGSAEFTVRVKGTEAYHYTWKKIEDASFLKEGESTFRLSDLTLAQAGHYYCIVRDVNGKVSINSDTLELKVYNIPRVSLTIDGGKNRIARGDSVRLVLSGDAADYSWNLPVPSGGGWVKPVHSTIYTVTGRNGNVCTTLQSVEVEVVELYVKPGPSLAIAPGQSGILSVETNADTVFWYARPLALSGRRSRMAAPPATHPEWGSYIGSGRNVTVTPDVSTVYTAIGYIDEYTSLGTVSVGVKAPSSYKGGEEDGFSQAYISFGVLPLSDTTTVCQDDSVTLVVTAKGVSTYDYAWYKINSSGNIRLNNHNVCKLRNCDFTTAGQYYCKITDRLSGDTLHSDTTYLKVYERPQVKVVQPATDTVICRGDTIPLKAGLNPAPSSISSSAVRFIWEGNRIVSGENTPMARVAPAVTTDYVVTADNNGCQSRDTISVRVNVPYVDLPSVTVAHESGQTEVYARDINGNRIDPSATDGFIWGINDTIVAQGTSVDNPYVIGSFDASYRKAWATVQVGACKASDTTYFKMKVATSFFGGIDDGFSQSNISFGISALPDTTMVCQNDSVILSVSVKGVSLYDYVWYKVGEPNDSLAHADRVKLRNCDFSTEGYYYCKVTDKLSGDTLCSDTVFVKVNERPLVRIFQPQNDTLICLGDTVYLRAGLKPDQPHLTVPDVNFSWTGSFIVGGESTPSVLVAPSLETDYIVTAEYNGCRTMDTLTVNVNIPYVDLPETIVAGENSDVDVHAKDRNGNDIDVSHTDRFIWGINTSVVGNSQHSPVYNPLHIPAVQPYIEKVWVSVTFGQCAASDTARVKLKVGASFYGGIDDGFTASCLDPTILQQFGQERLVCQEGGGNSMADSVVLRLVYEGTDVQFQWQKFNTGISDFEPVNNGNGIQGAHGPVLKFKPLEVSHNGSYRCILKNSCSSKVAVSDTFTVSVKGEPVIKSSTNNGRIRCKNDGQFTYNVIAEGATPDDVVHYQWSKDGRDLPGKDRNFLSIDLSEAANQVNGQYVSPAGLYVLRIWNDCGTVYDSARLIINEPAYLERQVEDPVFACEGERKEFSVQVGGGGVYEYELLQVDVGCNNVNDVDNHIINSWPGFSRISIPVSSSGKYIWRVRNECSKGEWTYSSFMTLQLDKKPSFVSVPEDQELCVGDPLVLECEASADSRNLFYWEKDNVVIPGQTGNRLEIQSVRASDAGVYRCYVYNECNPVSSAPIKVKVGDKPQLISISNIEQDYCEGDTVKIKANISTLWPVDSVRWYYKGEALYDDADGHLTGCATSMLSIHGVRNSDAEGAYTIEMVNACGSGWSMPVSFRLKEPARFVRGLDRGVNLIMCMGTSQTLYVEATGTPPVRYIWTHDGDTVANGNTNLLPIRNATVDTAGEYVCHVQNGCGDDITKTKIMVSYADTFRFEGGGHYCAGEGGLTAVLKGSDTTTLYRLYQEGNAFPLKEIHGRDVVPLRGYIVFDHLMAGTYYVTGKNKNHCEDRMPGTVEIIEDPLPEDYRLYVQRHMCEGETTGDLALPGSQEGILYYLLKDKTAGWDTLQPPYAGTGNPLLMTVGSGFYKVYAVDTATGCGRSLSGLDSITPRPYPVECELGVLDNDSVYCRGSQSDVTLTYGCFENGSSYTLWKNGQLMNPPKLSEPLQWPATEEGIYNIRVMNKWGCARNFGRQEVKIRELPRRFHVSGARIYCREESGDHMIDLQDSEEGVVYSFRYLPSVIVKDTMSVGGEIKLKVPLEEHKYYVVATDTTADHCSVSMLDTVEVRMSRLTVTPDPAEVYVEYGQQARLNIIIRNAEGHPVISWHDPENHIADSLNRQNPETKPWTWNSEEFLVTVADASGCNAETSVKVIRIGGKLEGGIRLGDCVTSRDTVMVCEGSEISLCAYAEGGIGNYVYDWSDLSNGSLGHNSSLTYTPSVDGYVWIDVRSGEQSLRDSVYILMGNSPRVDTLEPSYSRCVVPGAGEQIVLGNSEAGNSYFLEYSSDGQSYNYVSLTPTYGSDGKITFSLLDAAQFQGYLRIKAEHISSDGRVTCQSVMDQTVEIRVAPTRYEVTGGWNYCGDRLLRDTIVVNGAQQGVTYRLKKLPGTEIAAVMPVPGQDTVFFAGRYGAGDYVVTAEIGACRDTMNGVVTIVADTLPPIGNLIGQGAHCAMNCPVEIGITHGVPGVNYYLQTDSLNGGSSSQVYTTTQDTLIFGTYCTLGSYSVKAVNPVTGCEDKKAEVIIRETPDIQHLSGDTVYCEGSFGVHLNIDSTEGGARYYIEKWSADSGRWMETTPPVNITGNGFPVNISTYFTDGFYRLMSSLPCPAAMDSIYIRMVPLPEDTLRLQVVGNGCIDSAFVLQIDPREADVNYTLRFNGQPVTEVPVETATGIRWNFAAGEAGNYSVYAEREMCGLILPDSVQIDSLPQIYPLHGVEQLCQNDRGQLVMTSSERGVSYALYDTVAHAFTVRGVVRNDSVIFTGVAPGIYYPQAARGNCFVNGDLYTIRALPAPQPVNMLVSDCVEAGQGWIRLSGLQDSLEYIITGGNPALGPIRRYEGDTLLSDLPAGIYCVTVKDTLIGCESLSVCDTIREGVGADSITGDFYYCEGEYGARLTLSGTLIGVSYSIVDKRGNTLMTTVRPNRTFPAQVLQDTFVFRKERSTYLGTCRVDSVFEIREIPLPDDSVKVELTGGSVLCAGGVFYVNIHESQGGKCYVLQRQGATVGLDTVYGQEGQTVIFGRPLSAAGRYQVYVRDTNYECGVYLDTLITIASQPEPVRVDSCFYCYEAGISPLSDSCRIGLRGMLTGTRYRLSDGRELDTLMGPGNGNFRYMPAGDYLIIAESPTGCVDTMETTIGAVSMPRILDVVANCGEQGVLDTIYTYQLSERASDSVIYYLYKDGVRQPVFRVGDGVKPVGFGSLTQPGIYKIYAEKQHSLCGVFMKDSIVIVPPLSCTPADTLQVSGTFCDGSGDGVTLQYPCSVPGWKYYLQGMLDRSDTIDGGRTLMWSQIGRHSIWTGRYVLCAYNACSGPVALDTVDVTGKPAPQVFTIRNKNISLCEGNTFEIVLNGSEEGVVYTVEDGDYGGIKATVTAGSGGGPLLLGAFGAAGHYVVWAEKEGCRKRMDEVIVAPALLPQMIQLTGNDKCLSGAGNDSIQICMARRESHVKYYLYVNGRSLLDSLTDLHPGELCFRKQDSIGRYTVMAEHPTSHCRREMDGAFNMNEPPLAYDMENPGQALHLCQGTDTCLYMENSDPGISYVLRKDGVNWGTPAYTNVGGRLKVGCVSQSGIYQVAGRVGECETLMNDSVIVIVHPLPALNTENELHYCEFSTGAEVTVGYPTDSTVLYELYTPNGIIPLEARYGRGDNAAFSFIHSADSAGRYRVAAVDTATGCRYQEWIKVVEDKLPRAFDLISSSGNYICADGNGTCTEMSLSGSQTGVSYILYRLSPYQEMAARDGNGSAFRFPVEICDTGVYMVRGKNLSSHCEHAFNPVHIGRSDTVRRYNVVSVVNRYCSLDEASAKGIIELSGSQVGVEYEVYKNGIPLGLKKMGTGGVLRWEGLEGELCRHLGYPPRGGAVYAVLARDTLTHCSKQMNGTDTIVAEERIEILAQEPNEDIAVCERDSVQFSITTSGCGERYQWYHNGVAIAGETKSYYNIRSLDPVTDPGYYYCGVQNTCGYKESQMVKMTIYPLVRVRRKMEPIIICNPQQTNVLLASAFENAQYFVWYREGETENEWLSLKSTYEIERFDTTYVGKYVCKAWNGNHCNVVYDTCEVRMGRVPDVTVISGGDTTLCGGGNAYYDMEVRPGADVTFEWEFNGRLTGQTGNILALSSLSRANEGLYSVKATNSCGTVSVNVGRILVDDTIQVVSKSDRIMLRCPEEYETLFISTQPSDRVTYLWRQMPDPAYISRESYFRVGPMGTASPLNYRVTYSNKCSSGTEDFTIHVPRKIKADTLPRMIALCADCATDTVLRLNVDASMFAEYKWYYRANEVDSNRIYIEHEKADTLPIRLCSYNTGYYYCKVYNRCETDFTTETSWVRIDTVPVIHSLLSNDTVCEGMAYKDTLQASGGGLKYSWTISKKDGTVEVITNKDDAYLSTSVLNIPDIGMDYDSCRIVCYVENLCGKDTANSKLLRVLPIREVELSPAEQKVCEGDSAQIEVKLIVGDSPWEYRMEYPDGSLHTVSGLMQEKDTLRVALSGTYTLKYVNDAAGCIRTYALPKAKVEYYPVTDLVMSGSQSVCLDDTVSIRFEVTGGAGPWKVKVVDLRTGGIASELCGTDGLIFHGRDTVIRFAGVDTAEYSVNEVTDLGTGCGVQSLQDSVVKVIVNRSDHIEFTSGPWHVGQCRDANLLRDVLQPRLMSGNVLPANVHFYVNGVDRGVSGILPQGELRGDSCYRVVCRYTDTEGCGVSSDEVLVCVDSLPSGAVVSSDVACESVVNYFELELRPAGRIDSVVIRQARYKKWDSIVNPVVRPSYRTISYSKTQIPSDGLLQVPLNWDEVGGVDSCMTFEVLDIFDSHGCRMNHGISVREYDSLYRDTVWRHWDPVVDVEVRRSESKPWDRGVHEVNLPEGDSLQVKVTLVKGMPLWSLPTLGVDSIATMDTVFWLKREGVYYFQPKDLSCGRQSTTPPYDLTITHLDTGYFRGRLLLEGVYDESLGDMSWGGCNTGRLSDSLNLPAHLPLLPSHLDVIDWVEVELRVGSNIDSVAQMTDSSFLLTRDTCLLLSDGHLADRLTGDTIVGIRNAYGSGSNRRYVAVRHRNHLGVMTSRVYPFVKKTNKRAATFIDFTKSSTIYLSGVSGNDLNYHMTRKSKDGIVFWLLSAGELNTNSLVTLHDPNRVTWDDMHPTTSSVRVVGYRYDLLHDINLDGCVDWPGWNGTAHTDWLFVQRNRQKYTEVRWFD